ncbi:hypothetical protein BLA60_08680 [Actinophytocola xinjiangensis]|uniref:PPE family protein n=1 Tax=Actinophytocola xinjiangensis TaxID=485602 RepID=A0A7Z1B050_9PSEU|nr:hypothetical protein [Actinophytocola xinjiangensis]OLF12086.1 hypothetical protein BLA60_08680 [Actinophytocola xinjiangensis]
MTDLATSFDWLSVPHATLHRMVTERLDPDVGQSVAAEWTVLGERLSGVGDQLARLAAATADAWQGETATLATDGITALARWARDAGDTATDVAHCVARQADNAARARETMPPPSPPTVPAGEFDAARVLLDDQAAAADDRRTQHAQAARVMDQFQAASREVYRSVPRFAPPDPRHRPTEPAAATVTASTATGIAPAPGPEASAGGGGAGSAGVAAKPAPRPGVLAGAMTGQPPGGVGAGQLAARPGAQPGGLGAFPMGGVGAGREEDHERRGLFPVDDPGLWTVGEPPGGLMISASVIGALPDA